MLEKLTEALTNYFSEKHYTDKQIADGIAEATAIFNAGWDALEDGRVIKYNGDTVAIKKGNSVVVQKMVRDQWRMNCGKLIGDVKEITKTIDLSESQKEAQLAQAILVRFYTIPRM
jgi:hypothetical protein